MRAIVPLVLLAAAAAVGGAEPEAGTRPKPGARALFLKRCSSCHDPSRVHHRAADRDEWREIVERMRRMPQSGISREDARVILDYLVSLPRRPADDSEGGPDVYGDEWISVLETAVVKDGRVRLGGRDYEVTRDGRSATLRRAGETHVVALPESDEPPTTARVAQWRVGQARYEVHLILYRIRGESVRLGRALRRVP